MMSIGHFRPFGLALCAVFLMLPLDSNAQEDEVATRERLTILPMDRIALPIADGSEEIEVVVYTPHTYDLAQSYPLLIVPDADPLLGLLKTVNFLWSEEGKAVPVILVGVPFGATPEAIWENRSYYLLPDSVGNIDYYDAQIPLNNGGGASEFAGFLHERVLPTVLKRYSVDQSRIGLAGFSMGGLFAAWHFVTHPGIFSDYIIIAPPLAAPFVGAKFRLATEAVQRQGFAKPTRAYVAYAKNDLASVRSGAKLWIEALDVFDDTNFLFHWEVIDGHRHDSGAIPALINSYMFLYGREAESR